MSDNVFFSNKTYKLRGAGHVLPLRFQCTPALRPTANLNAITRSWWSQTESNRRHPACKAGALPTELWPHSNRNSAKPRRAVGDAVLRLRTPSEPEVLVGPGRLELPTLRLSGVRSNHLSYGPMAATARSRDPGSRSRHQYINPYGRCVDDESGKRNGDGGIPHSARRCEALR